VNPNAKVNTVSELVQNVRAIMTTKNANGKGTDWRTAWSVLKREATVPHHNVIDIDTDNNDNDNDNDNDPLFFPSLVLPADRYPPPESNEERRRELWIWRCRKTKEHSKFPGGW